MNYLDKDEYWMILVDSLKLRGKCPRRQTGALIVDANNHLISTGYNGPPDNYTTLIGSCFEKPCDGRFDSPGNSDSCVAVHAEQNALLQAGSNLRFAHILYSTNMPCLSCSKMIANTAIKKVLYLDTYSDKRGEILLNNLGIETIHFKLDK